MDKYKDRFDAGNILAKLLGDYKNRRDVLVLALPRGGVPVGYEVAKYLHVPLDVFIVRKLGVPGHPELAMGAMAIGDVFVFNEDIVADLHIPQSAITAVINEETAELKRRQKLYRGDKPFPSLAGKTIILVDDGVATGATMRAAIKALRTFKPTAIILAIPVADQAICDLLERQVDKLVCPLIPSNLYAVGAWYLDFTQTEDDDVYALLRLAHKQVPEAK
jgi:predicted phosphoribosyltransferase